MAPRTDEQGKGRLVGRGDGKGLAEGACQSWKRHGDTDSRHVGEVGVAQLRGGERWGLGLCGREEAARVKWPNHPGNNRTTTRGVPIASPIGMAISVEIGSASSEWEKKDDD
jgi:hypothetical protein